MTYTLLNNRDPYELVKLVNLYLENGWTCQGGLCMSSNKSFQAMIKEENKIPTVPKEQRLNMEV